MIEFLKKLFGIQPPPAAPPAVELVGDYTEEEIETIRLMMGTHEDPGPLKRSIMKFVNRQVENQVSMMRSCVAAQNWPAAAQHEGRVQAYQSMVFELEQVARLRKVARI